MKQGRVLSSILFLAGLALAFLGQFYFSNRRAYVRDGILLWCLAAMSFGLLLSRLRRKDGAAPGAQLSAWAGGSRWRLAATVGGIVLVLLASFAARGLPHEADFAVLLVMWLAGIAWFVLAFAPVQGRLPVGTAARSLGRRLTELLRDRRSGLSVAGLTALVVAGLLARAINLEHIPANLSGDEGTWGMEGLAMLANGLSNPFATRWFSFPSLSFLAWGAGMAVFGDTVAGLRALSALIGAATVLTTFLLADELWGKRVAWQAATVLAFSHFHIHFSRLAVNNIADGLVVTLSLWLLARGMRTARSLDFALAGVVIGGGWYGYFGARLVGVIVVAYVIWQVVATRLKALRSPAGDRFTAPHLRLGVVLVAAALVVAAPLLIHYAAHPAEFNSRSRQVSIFASGWLAREQEITGRSATSLLLQQVWKSISAFNYTLDPTFWYHPSIPLLDAISGVLFIAGLVWAVVHGGRPANALLLLWFGLAILVGWAITENPPSSMRLVIAAPALALLVSLGLKWLVGEAQRLLGGASLLWAIVPAAVLVAAAVLNIHYYFAVYTPTRVYGNPTAEISTELGRYLVKRNDECVVHFYGPPFIYWDFGTLRFITRGITGIDVPPVGEGEPVAVDPARGACFVFLPERLGEVAEVRARYPFGTEYTAFSNVDGRLLYMLYEVPAP